MRVTFVHVSLYERARLEDTFMGWWDCIVARIFRALFLLPPITGGSRLHSNEVYARFQSPPFLSYASSSSL